MLPEVGGSEMLLIAAIALIVVGPKDLPMLMRKVGQAVGKLKAMAGDLKAGLDDMAQQSELDDLRKEVEAMRGERFDPVAMTKASLAPATAPAGEPVFDAVAAHAANMAEYAQDRAAAYGPPSQAAAVTEAARLGAESATEVARA